MRSSKTTLGLLAVLLLVAPARADAWWGWLDDLSGPGRFRGPQFEFRVACFGEESEAKRLLDRLKIAEDLTRAAIAYVSVTPRQTPTPDFLAVNRAWSDL